MNGTQVIVAALKSTADIPAMYLSDLTDADLLVRPSPTANHIAWQFGHLISAEPHLMQMILPEAKYPSLPAGFDAAHNKETSTKDTGFLTKAAYLDIYAKVRQTTIAIAGSLSDADLDKPVTGNMAKFAPTWGVLLLLVSNHVLMHAGQFTVVRRKLGKPIIF